MKYPKILLLISITLGITMLSGCVFHPDRAFDPHAVVTVNTDQSIIMHDTAAFAQNLAVVTPEETIVGGFDATGIGTALLVDDTDAQTIVSYGGDQKIYPASMTKVMSGILIAEALENGTLNMDQVVTVSQNIVLEAGAAKLNLMSGDQITVKNLVYGYLVRSLNDCGIVLAQQIAGSEAAFVELMNQKAQMLGATHTHFVNCHGLHNDDHYTTAYDLYLFFREFASHELVHEIDQITKYDLSYTNAAGEPVMLTIESTNGFLAGTYPLPSKYQIGAWKSGTTKAAGFCLIMQVQYQEHSYFAVICKADDRDMLYKKMAQLVQCIPEE